MMASSSFCFSGAALGAALASLFLRNRREGAERDLLQQQFTMMQTAMQTMLTSLSHSPPEHEPTRPSLLTSMGKSGDKAVSKSLTSSFDHIDTQDIPLASWASFTMEDARRAADERAQKVRDKTPSEVFAELQRGNARFWTGQAKRPERNAFERRMLIAKQHPATAILGCSDSRVPTEIIFDQGLGDMFVVRVAGNFMDVSTAASLEYAVGQLKVKVLIVLGHEGCGAIRAALQPTDANLASEAPMLATALRSLRAGLDGEKLKLVHDFRARDREAVLANVRRQVKLLTTCESIMKAVKNGELMIVGAFYEISSGIVDFVEEVSAQSRERAESEGAQAVFDLKVDYNFEVMEPPAMPDWPFPPRRKSEVFEKPSTERHQMVFG